MVLEIFLEQTKKGTNVRTGGIQERLVAVTWFEALTGNVQWFPAAFSTTNWSHTVLTFLIRTATPNRFLNHVSFQVARETIHVL